MLYIYLYVYVPSMIMHLIYLKPITDIIFFCEISHLRNNNFYYEKTNIVPDFKLFD